MATLKKFHIGVPTITIDDPQIGMESNQWPRADYHIICVPTQQMRDGNLDLSAIYDAISRAKDQGFRGRTVIRSTINPMDYNKIINNTFKVPVAWPEFLREAHWEQDANDPKLVVMGGPSADLLAANFKSSLNITLVEDPNAAWMMKVARNAYYALKVIVANDIVDACDQLNIDYTEVKAALLSDPMIGPSHWDQPGHDGSMGFGGKCLPKDTASLDRLLCDLGNSDNFAAWALAKNQNLRG
jgi:nucleotide sugar dehydrogenase